MSFYSVIQLQIFYFLVYCSEWKRIDRKINESMRRVYEDNKFIYINALTKYKNILISPNLQQ